MYNVSYLFFLVLKKNHIFVWFLLEIYLLTKL